MNKEESANNVHMTRQEGHPSAFVDDIDLGELVMFIWCKKWWLIVVTLLFTVLGIVYAISLPNLYESEGIYAPNQKPSSSVSVPSQLGGLAAIAGVNLGGNDADDISQAVVLLTSWPFLETVIDKYDLKPYLLGVTSWDAGENDFDWDEEVYDSVNMDWIQLEYGQSSEPTSYQAYRALREMMRVEEESATSLLTISVEHYSPLVAEQWVELLLAELNSFFQNRDIADAENSIAFLEEKISETSFSEMQQVFYGLIEEQTKTLMLAQASEEYLLRTVVEPKAPELKASPNRPLIVLLSGICGTVFSAVILIGVGLLRRSY